MKINEIKTPKKVLQEVAKKWGFTEEEIRRELEEEFFTEFGSS